jgi:hypothetical protein
MVRSFLCLLWLISSGSASAQPVAPPDPLQPSYSDWQAACAKLPQNRVLRGRLPATELLPLRSFAPLDALLDSFGATSRTGALARTELWLGTPPSSDFYDLQRGHFFRQPSAFEPFVQREQVGSGTEVILNGDLHGDIHSILGRLAWLNQKGYLSGFKVIRPDVRLVFLGDYVDRGVYGVEVLYTILRLKLENPQQVILVRGNHEDYRLAANYGFFQEGVSKYGRSFNPVKIARVFDFLPVALYLGSGTNYAQCNHGGVEPGYNPAGLLEAPATVRYERIAALRQATFFREHPDVLKGVDGLAWSELSPRFIDCVPTGPTVPVNLGFMWNDFTVTPEEPALAYDPGRSSIFGPGPTQAILRLGSGPNTRLRAVFRAHQHSTVLNPMMSRLLANRGVYRHWQEEPAAPGKALDPKVDSEVGRRIAEGSVWTVNVSPDTPYGLRLGYEFDAFCILRTEASFEDWRMRVINLESKAGTTGGQ